MQLPKAFDASQVKPAQAIEVMPIAWYPVTITASELKDTSKKNGQMLALEMTVVSGDHKGRKIFDNLNIVNSNAQAVEIAYATLSAISHATGVIKVDDSQQLHNIPFEVKLGMAKPDPEYPDPRNEVKGYRKLGGNTSGTATTAPVVLPPADVAAPAPDAAMPWNTVVDNSAALATALTAPVVTEEIVAPVVAAPPPAPTPAPPAAPVIVAEPVKTMTAKAAGATYEQFLANKWTDEMMLRDGYMILVAPIVEAPVATGDIPPPWAA